MKIGIDARLWYETGVGRYIRALTTHLGRIDDMNDYVLFLTSKTVNDFSPPNSRWHVKLADVSWHSVEEQVKIKTAIFKEVRGIIETYKFCDFPCNHCRLWEKIKQDILQDIEKVNNARPVREPQDPLKDEKNRL